MRQWWIGVGAVMAIAGCSDGAGVPLGGGASNGSFDDLPVGAVEGMKTDRGSWGHATTCKEIPDLPPLVDPVVTVSRNGLTLHLRDRAGDYDRIFPIGIGQIEDGESLTPVSASAPGGVFWTRLDAPPTFDGPTPEEARWGWNQQCRSWWTDEDGEKIPVFAGLPFIRLSGPRTSGYGIHGPIDRFTQPNGGTLRRGYVSHGCIRMEAADLVEVYARLNGHRAPVTIQHAVERSSEGRAIDLPGAWVGTECVEDAECDFEGGFCQANAYSGRGFCTMACAGFCPDMAGTPPTFCVDNPDGDDGMCVNQAAAQNNDCKRYDHMPLTSADRHGPSGVVRDVCLPGTPGWIGDGCVADDDCDTGLCSETTEGTGVCAASCERYCPDKDGGAATFCVDAEGLSGLEGGVCTARCINNDDCAVGTTCESGERYSQPSVVQSACVPY